MKQKVVEVEKVKEVEKEEISNKDDNKNKSEKKKGKIFGFTIIQILAYFIIYSVIGYFVETIFALVTKGVLESRQSFLYGPFCSIYGVGAVIMIISLQRFKKNNYTLFLGGFIVGSIIEYVISLIGEFIFNIKWWDYSNMPFNLNGRICVWFSLFWGVLAIYLMTHIHPKVDKFLGKIPERTVKITTIILTILLIINFIVTCFALKVFFIRLVRNENLDIDIQGVEQYAEEYDGIYNNETVKNISDKLFSDEKMVKTFPNIKVTKKDGNIIWICDILDDIQPYYIKLFTPRTNYLGNLSKNMEENQ